MRFWRCTLLRRFTTGSGGSRELTNHPLCGGSDIVRFGRSGLIRQSVSRRFSSDIRLDRGCCPRTSFREAHISIQQVRNLSYANQGRRSCRLHLLSHDRGKGVGQAADSLPRHQQRMSRLPSRASGRRPSNQNGSRFAAANRCVCPRSEHVDADHWRSDGCRPQRIFQTAEVRRTGKGRARLRQLSRQSRTAPRIVRTGLRELPRAQFLGDCRFSAPIADVEGLRPVS